MDAPKKPFSMLKLLWKISIGIFSSILIAGLLFGMAFIIGIFVFIFTGNDMVLSLMSNLLDRIIELTNHFK